MESGGVSPSASRLCHGRDEPTSGLDSASALQIVGALCAMAETRGRTVLLSIHQPRARIVKMFDSVLLLAAGSVLHQGTVDQLRALLGDAGLHRLCGRTPPPPLPRWSAGAASPALAPGVFVLTTCSTKVLK